jgi:uncharacterized protein (DUF983 family)
MAIRARTTFGFRAAARALTRGLRKRCPRCGRGRLFRTWFSMVEQCPGCGLRFEREEGYWVGGMIVNFAVTELAFAIVFATGLAIYWPDVPWGWLTVVAVAVNAVVPLAFYPFSKTIWLALDGLLRRMDRQDDDVSGEGEASSSSPLRSGGPGPAPGPPPPGPRATPGSGTGPWPVHEDRPRGGQGRTGPR